MSRPLPYLPARAFALLAAAAAAFTLYGSLVPFHYEPRPFADAVAQFQRLMVERLWPSSRSDFGANLLLGVPLGFGLLAALRVDRPADPAKTAFYAVAVWPWTALFAGLVEFSQLYFPGRTCAGSDVLAQSLGSAAGMLVWVLAGPKLVRWLRGVWASPRVGGTAGRLLLVYLGLLALAQMLPLDLTASPKEVYDLKWKGGRTVLVPFSEPAAEKLPVWMELGGLYAIAGLLAAGVPAVRGWRAVGFPLLLAAGIECGQLLVKSRTSSATDVLLGTTTATAGWLVGRLLRRRVLSLEFGLLLVQIWAAGLIVGGWLPFDFDPTAGHRWAGIDWMPFAAQIEKNYMNGLEEMLTKTLLYAPVGAVAGGAGGRAWLGGLAAALLAALIEGGQVYLPGRFPGPTDLLFAAAGGWLGATAVRRLTNGPRPGRTVGPRTQHTIEVTA